MRILGHVHDLRSDDPDNPAYQVTFWGRSQACTDLPREERPFEAEVWQLADTDVKEVIEWADSNVGDDRTYQIEVAVGDQDTVSNLIRLYGRSPISSTPQDPPAWFDAGQNGLRLR
jgi:hypothetical protein